MYPNPFKDIIRIANAEDCILQIMDTSGAVVHIQKITGNSEIVHLEQLTVGAYFFRVEKDGKTKTIKAVKE
jgi:hypothetical protein